MGLRRGGAGQAGGVGGGVGGRYERRGEAGIGGVKEERRSKEEKM